MTRFAIAAFAALLLLAPAAATGAGADASRVQLRGTVAQTLPANKLVRVDTSRVAHILRVPGSQARIHVGQRVALRGTTLRERGNGSRVLARGVVLAGSARKGSSSVSSGGSGSNDAGQARDQGDADSADAADGVLRLRQRVVCPGDRPDAHRLHGRRLRRDEVRSPARRVDAARPQARGRRGGESAERRRRHDGHR